MINDLNPIIKALEILNIKIELKRLHTETNFIL